MDIGIRDILTLSDKKEYVVVSKILYENKTYLFLIDLNDEMNIKICYLNDDEVIETRDKELNTKLLPLFVEETKKIVENNFSE